MLQGEPTDDETNEDSYTSDAVQLMQGPEIAEDAST
jgi:hypothetical protein